MSRIHINERYKDILNGKSLIIPQKKSWEYIYDNNHLRKNNIAMENESMTIRITYDEMFANWFNAAKAFNSIDIGKNSRVLVIAPNTDIVSNITYGLNMVGAVVDFIDPTSSSEIIEKYISQENITDIICLDALFEKNLRHCIKKMKEIYNLKNIIIYEDKYITSTLPFIVKNYIKLKNLDFFRDKNIKLYSDLIRNSVFQKIDFDEYDKDKLSLITHTSGTTTGIGKPIPLTDDNRNAIVYQHELAELKFEPGMKMLHFIPWFAAYGSCNTAHLGFGMGMDLIQIPLFDPRNFGKLLLKCKPNIVLANTPAWIFLMKDSTMQNADLSFLNCAVSGGTPTNPEDEILLNKFLVDHGAKCILTKGHGLSELCGCASYTLDGYNHIGGMGVPLPLTEYKFKNLNTGEFLDSNMGKKEGEAFIHSPNMTIGILDGKQVVPIVEINGKKYLKTNDIIRENEDGSLNFIERKDRMFPRFDAYNVYPARIEETLISLPEIKECVVSSYWDDNYNSKMPVVYFVLNDEYVNIEIESFITHVIEEIFINNKFLFSNIYKPNFRDIPTKWITLGKIPKNTMGKPDYKKLEELDTSKKELLVDMDSNNIKVKSFKLIRKNFEKEKVKK